MLRWVLLLIAAVIATPLGAAEPACRIEVVTDREDALYEIGEQARFLITVTRGDEPVSGGTVSYTVDDFVAEYRPPNDFPQGELELNGRPLAVTATSPTPGFLRCRVSFQPEGGKPLSAVAGAGFSPEKIEPSLPVPDDFDRFWADQKRQLAEVPMEAKLTPVEQSDAEIDCFDVEVACLGEAPVSGYLAVPKRAAAKSLPAILWVHGAGVRSSVLANAVKGAKAGAISMDINAHGSPNGKPAEFYRELAAGRLKNYRHDGRESRETVYFRGMFLRLVRAIDFLTARPEWDGKIVAVVGHSQGGGQALAAGGLDPRVTMIASGVPAICDHSGRAAGRINGWPKIVPTQPDGKPDPTILRACRYVDAVNFASRCRADAIISVGFIDAVCPPSTCYAAYNSLLGEKQVINEPRMGHAAPSHIHKAFFECVLEHIARRTGQGGD
jgi:cephalosporin-C deacetylase-like acetyl esterase